MNLFSVFSFQYFIVSLQLFLVDKKGFVVLIMHVNYIQGNCQDILDEL